MYLISNCVVRRSCAIKQDLEIEEFFSPLYLFEALTIQSKSSCFMFVNFFKSKMGQDSEENMLMFFTRLCLKELESSSPEVKVSELYMRRRCRERWSKMDEEERAAICRLAGDVRDDNALQQEDINENNCPIDGAAAEEVEVDDGDEWQPEKKKKKRKHSQTPGRLSAYNVFCMSVREKRGQKIGNRC